MSDAEVAAALRSASPLVVIEAPGGCGKTHQGSLYAADAAALSEKRILILTPTNAACDVFASRTKAAGSKVEIRTIDGLTGEIAGAYRLALGLPEDIALWARTETDGYARLSAMVADLLDRHSAIAAAIAGRYPFIICDEHQDATADQHRIIMRLHAAGAALRIFADPMQRIFGERSKALIEAEIKRWDDLKAEADVFAELDTPHRWDGINPALGAWIMSAREQLRSGAAIDLKANRPAGLHLIDADNVARAASAFRLSTEQRRPLNQHMRTLPSVLVLASHNATILSLRGFFGRSIPVWEGHVREALDILCEAHRTSRGNPAAMARAARAFVEAVATGFTRHAFGDRLVQEVDGGCTTSCRGKPATLQALGRLLVDEPDHRGIAKFLASLRQAIREDPAFATIKLDLHHELNDAIRLGGFDDPDAGLAEIARRRTHARIAVPTKALSTIHKAKGLEFENVVLFGCDRSNFGDTAAARAKLYVAMSRATKSLCLLISRAKPTPLFEI